MFDSSCKSKMATYSSIVHCWSIYFTFSSSNTHIFILYMITLISYYIKWTFFGWNEFCTKNRVFCTQTTFGIFGSSFRVEFMIRPSRDKPSAIKCHCNHEDQYKGRYTICETWIPIYCSKVYCMIYWPKKLNNSLHWGNTGKYLLRK